MFRFNKEGRGASRSYRIGAIGLALAMASGAALLSSAAGASSKTTITIWNDPLAAGSVGVPASKSFLTKGVNLFMKANPNITVKILQEPMGSTTAFNTLLQSSELAGTTPDIGQLYVGGQVLQNAKFLDPLNKALGSSYINSLTGWQFVTKDYKPGSTIYAVPYGAGYYYTVYYNKKLFAKAGITGALPTTWNSLVTLAKKLKAKGVTPFEFGEKEGYFGAWTMDSLMSLYGGNQGVLNMYTGKASLDTNELIKPYEAWHALFAQGLTNSNAATLTYTTGVANFAAGQAAMTITGQYYDTQISKGLGKNVGLFPVPALSGSKYPKSLSGGPNNSYVIFKTSKNVKDDVKLIKFLTSIQVQTLSVQELGQLPNNVSFKATSAFAAAQPLLTELDTYISKDHYALDEAFDNIMPGSIDSYWYQTNNGVFSGALSPQSAASSMQSQMKSYLATAATG
ncbi:MAG TPA: extracellular solute-binding protein [Acidimicrobiales bacterium]|jgi:raffinose/stachyose/melibiose transport system substrate-binding protein|nr:extracellular solute-binding protein [Acidimicrobiales bacterium]